MSIAQNVGNGVIALAVGHGVMGAIVGAAVGFLGGRAVCKLTGSQKPSSNGIQAGTTLAGMGLGAFIAVSLLASKMRLF